MRKLVVLGSVLVVALVAVVAGIAMREPTLPPVGPTDPICEQVVREREPDLVFTRNDLQKANGTTRDVPFGELPGHRGKVVRVVGFLVVERGEASLFLSRNEVLLGSDWSRHRVVNPYLRDLRESDYWTINRGKLSYRCARVQGVYSDSYPERGQPPLLLYLQQLEVWSEPYRPPPHLPAPPPPQP